jgi:DNA invertase Pin-like site-specific DNA recombinase
MLQTLYLQGFYTHFIMYTHQPPPDESFHSVDFTQTQYPVSIVKTRAQIADEYGISVRTLYRWLKKHHIEVPSGVLKPVHQILIYQAFGAPGK